MDRLACAFFILAVSAVLAGAETGSTGSTGGENKSASKVKNAAEGVWLVVGMERNGAKMADEVIKGLDMKLTVMGLNYTVTVKGNVVDKGTSEIDMSKTPNTVESKSEEEPGKTILGIRQVDGDSMKACYDLTGKERPTAFATREGSGHVLILYRRLR